MPLVTIPKQDNVELTPVQYAYNRFVESNQSFFNSASNFLNELNALFYGQENPYTAQDLWNLVGTNGAVSLQVLGLLIQALQTANPEYVAPVIPDQLTPNADGTVTDTQPIN